MSDHQDRNHPNNKKSNSTALSNALADALKKAGIKQNQINITTKSPKREPANTQASQSTTTVTEEVLFKRYMENTTPLKKKKYINLGGQKEAATTDANTNPLNNIENHKQIIKKSGQNKTKPKPEILRQTTPDVECKIGQDGQKQVVIKGFWLEPGGNGKKNENSQQKKNQKSTKLIVDGIVSLSPSLSDDYVNSDFSDAHAAWSSYPSHVNDDGEMELFIGLDFGTSFCKVVVQEPGRGQSWATPFTNSNNPYLLATRVSEKEGMFMLNPTGNMFANLKMALFSERVNMDDLIRASAFIGLTIRHVKNWYWKHKAIDFISQNPIWNVHMGIPARNFENKRITNVFKKTLWAGMLLAEVDGSSISKADVNRALNAIDFTLNNKLVLAKLNSTCSVHQDQIGIYPEIAAQIFGFINSDFRDPSQNTFLLVDVGGGTVDAALFQVIDQADGGTKFIFRACAVEALGVFMLHRERIHWLVDQLFQLGSCQQLVEKLRLMHINNTMPEKIPGLITEYLTGVKYPELTSDSIFYNAFSLMLWDNIIMAVKNRFGKIIDKNKRLQFMLSGGGRTIGLYNKFIKFINSPKSNSQLRLHQIEMGLPRSLDAQHIGLTEFHRLSVAYGLSFMNIGEVITPDMLEDTAAPINQIDLHDFYIRKEMV